MTKRYHTNHGMGLQICDLHVKGVQLTFKARDRLWPKRFKAAPFLDEHGSPPPDRQLANVCRFRERLRSVAQH
ncbi:hypothetical protein SB861_55590, partial [Paraburkholderia sp. SIMBA_049]